MNISSRFVFRFSHFCLFTYFQNGVVRALTQAWPVYLSSLSAAEAAAASVYEAENSQPSVAALSQPTWVEDTLLHIAVSAGGSSLLSESRLGVKRQYTRILI